MHFAIQDERRTNAGADDNVDHVALAASGTKVILAQRGGFGIVLQGDWQQQPINKHLAQRHVDPTGQVGRIEQHPCPVIQRSGEQMPTPDSRAGGQGRLQRVDGLAMRATAASGPSSGAVGTR